MIEPELVEDLTRLERVQHALLAWFDAEQIALPWRQGRTAYVVLVSEFMLQQTQRERVAPKFREFMLRFPDLQTLAAASTADAIRAWAGLGYNSRAVRLQQIARRLDGAGQPIPAGIDELRSLPGVGDYTARAISCFGYGHSVACVDTNIRRVLGRIFVGCEGEDKATRTPAADLALAECALVRGRPADWNAALMDLGALICRARQPVCGRCPVAAWCVAQPEFAKAEAPSRRQVAEARSAYGAASSRSQRQEPFAASDRYLRGRIVDVLRGLPHGAAIEIAELAVRASGMALPPQTERVQSLAERLVRDGLIVRADAGVNAAYRLPD